MHEVGLPQDAARRTDAQGVVTGAKQRALFGWDSHLCTASGPSAKAMGTHGPLDPAAPEGKTGAARGGPREACLICADPWDTGLISLRDWARRGLLNGRGATVHARLMRKANLASEELRAFKTCNCLYN